MPGQLWGLENIKAANIRSYPLKGHKNALLGKEKPKRIRVEAKDRQKPRGTADKRSRTRAAEITRPVDRGCRQLRRVAAGFLRDAGKIANDWAAVVGILATAGLVLITLALPRWKGFGRNLADRLPVFAIYRLHTGIYFLRSMAALMSVGISATEAIDRIRPSASPYVGHRIDIVRFHLLNGHDLGSALDKSGTGWPDPDLNLSLGIFSQTPNFPSQLSALADEWLESARDRAEQRAGILRMLALLAIFGVISGVALALYDIQSQVTAGFH